MGVWITTSATSAAGFNFLTTTDGLAIFSSVIWVIGVVGVGCGMVLNKLSMDLTMLASCSLRSEAAFKGLLIFGALIVLVIVFTTSAGRAENKNRRGTLLVFCQVNLVG